VSWRPLGVERGGRRFGRGTYIPLEEMPGDQQKVAAAIIWIGELDDYATVSERDE
jgi:hypothetical protein